MGIKLWLLLSQWFGISEKTQFNFLNDILYENSSKTGCFSNIILIHLERKKLSIQEKRDFVLILIFFTIS